MASAVNPHETPGSVPQERREWLTVDEAAAALSVSRGTAYEAVRTGQLEARRFGRVVRVPRRAVEGGFRFAVHARVSRLRDALRDGDADLALAIADDLEADLAAQQPRGGVCPHCGLDCEHPGLRDVHVLRVHPETLGD